MAAPTTCGHRDINRLHDCTEPRWKVGATYCAEHEAEYRQTKRQPGAPGAPRARRASAPSFDSLRVAPAGAQAVSDDDLAHSHEYVPMPDLAALWHAVVTGSQTRPAANLLFLGPSGSGKTDGARYLAALAGLDFVKVDAASMTDPEAWFGTREIVVQDGVAVTDYRPSAFVEALGKPGVILIDEINRVRDEHRNVLLPLLDATRAVTNPLTGDIVARDPKCFVIMAGNSGIRFTGTSAIDPAFVTRAITVEFDYIDATSEARIVADASGCAADDAAIFVRFAGETRAKSAIDPEFSPISTRELIEAGRLVADGLSRDLAVKFVVLSAASGEGGASSVRQELQNVWNGVRVAKPSDDSRGDWNCPVHGTHRVIPAGVSAKTGKPYTSFRACPVSGCSHTQDKSGIGAGLSSGTVRVGTCFSCGNTQPMNASGATTCFRCGRAI